MCEDVAEKLTELGYDAPKIGEAVHSWVPKVYKAFLDMHKRLTERLEMRGTLWLDYSRDGLSVSSLPVFDGQSVSIVGNISRIEIQNDATGRTEFTCGRAQTCKIRWGEYGV